jgi:3-isopropylmalate dehydrogenase
MYKILTLPGDGIGPEVMDATLRVLGWFGRRGFKYETEEALVGGIAYEKLGRSDPDETMAKAKAADVVLLGAVGGPQWDNLPFHQKPERGLSTARARIWRFSPISARRSASMPSRTPRRSSRKSWRGSIS